MNFTEKDLDNLSQLARIDIDPSEKEKMLADMQSILGYVSEINNVKGERVYGEESVFNMTREDSITRESGSNTEVLLGEAPSTKNGYVKVGQVLK
jgi:aspartyl/glutamyl-tRNA(Asn/Gln) amidotransferase C subunit